MSGTCESSKNRSDGHGELLAAIAATVQSIASRLAVHFVNILVAAMGAHSALRPENFFEIFAHLIFGKINDVLSFLSRALRFHARRFAELYLL